MQDNDARGGFDWGASPHGIYVPIPREDRAPGQSPEGARPGCVMRLLGWLTRRPVRSTDIAPDGGKDEMVSPD